MAVLHEEIASMLLLLDAKQGKDLEKLVKKHKGSMEGTLVRTHRLMETTRQSRHSLMQTTL
jgi:hypothetical protein